MMSMNSFQRRCCKIFSHLQYQESRFSEVAFGSVVSEVDRFARLHKLFGFHLGLIAAGLIQVLKYDPWTLIYKVAWVCEDYHNFVGLNFESLQGGQGIATVSSDSMVPEIKGMITFSVNYFILEVESLRKGWQLRARVTIFQSFVPVKSKSFAKVLHYWKMVLYLLCWNRCVGVCHNKAYPMRSIQVIWEWRSETLLLYRCIRQKK